jgi:hypothetical protein
MAQKIPAATNAKTIHVFVQLAWLASRCFFMRSNVGVDRRQTERSAAGADHL